MAVKFIPLNVGNCGNLNLFLGNVGILQKIVGGFGWVIVVCSGRSGFCAGEI